MANDSPKGTERDPSPPPFPSRREIHGSRIPSRKGGPPTSSVPRTPRPTRTPETSPPVASPTRRVDAAKPVEPASPPTSETKPAFPTRRQHLTETGALPVSKKRAKAGAPQPAIRKTAPVATVKKPAQVKAKRAPKWRVALVLIILVALVGGAVYLALNTLGRTSTTAQEELDFPGPGEGSVEVTITSGEVGSEIGRTLVDAGVVKTVQGFTRAFEGNSAAATIKPGTYTLKLGMTSAAALAALLDEANRRDNAITVNAGQTAEQVFEKLVTVGGFTDAQIEEALSDPDALGLPAEADGNVEGWLGTGSYELGADATASDALTAMIDATKAKLKDLDAPEDQWQEILIKASILEREAGLEEDMPKVARVISNRLAQPDAETHGLLQMDSTVLYGVGKRGGLPTSEDLESDTPYNTYKVKGLPPTPIASPSTAAIEATLHPAEGDWLYFVTVNLDTGETLFTSDLDKQTENIELLRQWCEANEGRC